MAYTVEQITTLYNTIDDVMTMLDDVKNSAQEWLDTMDDKEADADDQGMATEALEGTLDGVGGSLVDLSNLMEGM